MKYFKNIILMTVLLSPNMAMAAADEAGNEDHRSQAGSASSSVSAAAVESATNKFKGAVDGLMKREDVLYGILGIHERPIDTKQFREAIALIGEGTAAKAQVGRLMESIAQKDEKISGMLASLKKTADEKSRSEEDAFTRGRRAAEAEARARLEAVTAEARAAEARAEAAEVKIRRMMAKLREVEVRNRRLISGILETAAAADAKRRLARGDICESRRGCFGGVPLAVALQQTPQKLATRAAILAYLQREEDKFDVRPMASLDDVDLDDSTTVVPDERTDLATGGTGGSVLGGVDERAAASPARGPRSADKPLLKPKGSSSR